MKEHWRKIEQRLTDLGCLDEMRLRVGAASESLIRLETHLGVRLPESLKGFLSVHDGQDGFGLLLGEEFLSVSGIQTQWDAWRSIDEDEMNKDCAEFMASEPPGFIKPLYTNRKWIPLTSDAGGNHIGLDYDPDGFGRVGQVIAFGRDEDTKRLLANDFSAFLDICVSWLNQATWDGEYLNGPA